MEHVRLDEGPHGLINIDIYAPVDVLYVRPLYVRDIGEYGFQIRDSNRADYNNRYPADKPGSFGELVADGVFSNIPDAATRAAAEEWLLNLALLTVPLKE